MGGRKEILKRVLAIPEYPWSSDDEEDSSGLRTNTNPHEPQPSTSHQRPTINDRPNSEPHETTNPRIYKPFLPITPPVIEERSLRQVACPISASLHSANLNRINRNSTRLPGTLTNGRRLRHYQNLDSRKLSADINRIFALKRLTPGIPSRSTNRFINALNSVNIPSNRHDRMSTNSLAIAGTNNNIASRIALYNSEVQDVDMVPASKVQPYRMLNIKSEENSSCNVELAGTSASTSASPSASAPASTLANAPSETLVCAPDAITSVSQLDAIPSVDINIFNNDTEDVSFTIPEENLEDIILRLEGRSDRIKGILRNNARNNNNVEGARENPILNVDDPSTSTRNDDTIPEEAEATVKEDVIAADKTEEPTTVAEFNKKLIRLLECPVCMDWMEPPISQCRRGHLVCSRCQTRLNVCPVCRSLFSSVRNRAMEEVADMLSYPCRHGCGQDVKLKQRGPHEASCLARKYQCPAIGCTGRTAQPYSELLLHIQMKHFYLMILGNKHDFSIKVNTDKHANWLIMAFDEVFYLRVDVDLVTWGIIAFVSYIGPKSNANKFIYEICVEGLHNARKLMYTRETHSDLESPSLNMSRKDCFHLNFDQTLNYLRFKNQNSDREQFLNFNVVITQSHMESVDVTNTES